VSGSTKHNVPYEKALKEVDGREGRKGLLKRRETVLRVLTAGMWKLEVVKFL